MLDALERLGTGRGWLSKERGRDGHGTKTLSPLYDYLEEHFKSKNI